MEFFAKIVNGFQLLTIFAKSSIADIRIACKYEFGYKNIALIPTA